MSEELRLKLEDLIVGKGSGQFRKLESLVDVFCPFEAIGMVSQEIRHAKYLAYIMDPNRPHGFGSVFLREFLMILADLPESGLSKLKIHMMDLSNAKVSLEWKRIDILIEVPSGETGGIIVAVELKINAEEGVDQLERYMEVINGCKSESWAKEFVFLTKNEGEASTAGWLNIGMAQLVREFEAVFEANHFSGESANLFKSYTKMMRRWHLGDSKTDEIARDLWAKHYEALSFLMQYKPDRMSEIFSALKALEGKDDKDNVLIGTQLLANDWSIGEKYTVKVDQCEPQIFRFYVEEWSKFKGMQTSDSAVLQEKNILIFEMREWGNSIRVFFLLTTGDEKARHKIFDAAKADSRIKLPKRSAPKAGSVKFLSADFVLNKKNFEAMVADGIEEDAIQEIRRNATMFFKKHIPIYDEVLRDAFAEP